MEKEFQTYLFEYKHAGDTWGFDIKASSPEDACERLRKLSEARFIGTGIMKIPITDNTKVPVGIFIQMMCWLRNNLFAR